MLSPSCKIIVQTEDDKSMKGWGREEDCLPLCCCCGWRWRLCGGSDGVDQYHQLGCHICLLIRFVDVWNLNVSFSKVSGQRARRSGFHSRQEHTCFSCLRIQTGPVVHPTFQAMGAGDCLP
jgi:hypothetical protein